MPKRDQGCAAIFIKAGAILVRLAKSSSVGQFGPGKQAKKGNTHECRGGSDVESHSDIGEIDHEPCEYRGQTHTESHAHIGYGGRCTHTVLPAHLNDHGHRRRHSQGVANTTKNHEG